MTKECTPKPEMRIPNGTRVTWYARYPEDPINSGVVRNFKKAVRGSADTYTVDVDFTPAGNLRKTVKVMHPYAANLEAQNQDLLRPVA